MNYDIWRRRSIEHALDVQLTGVVGRYKPEQPTVCLLPGGMGSQLNLSSRRHNPAEPIPANPVEPVWLDFGVTSGEAHSLRITDGRDYGNRVIAPCGAVNFPPFIEPYVFLKNFVADDKGWNFVEFGYDWRRPLSESAEMLRYFLAGYRERVVARWNEDPLQNTHLVYHSMGGMVAMLFVHQLTHGSNAIKPADTRAWFDKIISIATPYYGTATHLERYYEGCVFRTKLTAHSD